MRPVLGPSGECRCRQRQHSRSSHPIRRRAGTSNGGASARPGEGGALHELQACGPVDSVLGPSAPTCFVTNYTSSSTSTLPQYCRLPYELRVGLTISLTGPLAHVDTPNSTSLRIRGVTSSTTCTTKIRR
ncbi:unnamed protein product [Symbiodinium natans]|uniref:Uncharacterized protein n=1 Tax=Symbiodinium natans TaxID=878477 RepID=A0A812L3B7_9DINO|nr:unnamed protein product [Symbiodinium natans]